MPDPVTHLPSRSGGARRFAPGVRSRLGAVALWVALGPGAAFAQDAADTADETEAPTDALEAPAPEEAPPDRRPRVAVLLLATGDLDPATADGLSELLIGAVAARGGVRILGKEEFQAQLGRGEAGTIECISSMPCIGRVGVELGVREVIAGTLARRGDTWVFSLDRVDVASGETVGRVFREVEGDLGAVADALSEAVPDLYALPDEQEGPPAPPATATLTLSVPAGAEVTIDGAVIGVATDAPLRRSGLSPGPHEVRIVAPERLPWTRTVSLTPGAELHLEPRLAEASRTTESVHPLVWIGAGVAAASLGVAIALGVSSQQTLPFSPEARRDGNVTRADVVRFYDAREREAIAADVLFGVAAAAALAGAVSLFFPISETVPAELSLWPGGAAVRGRF